MFFIFDKMIKYNPKTLLKLEQLFKKSDYIVRYERGQFQSGYCLVKDKKVIVINKFYTVDAKIGCFLEMLQEIQLPIELLNEDLQQFYVELQTVKPKK